ncbi:MAG: vWA domain-containing protein [Bacteroidota bacterium]
MVLGQPAALWGLTLVLVPLYIHFFGFRLRKKALFTRLDWLIQQQIPVRRRERLFRLLLLATRILAIVALVLAFAQPSWNSDSPYAGQNSVQRHLLYLDNSPSMLWDGEEGLLLEQAKTLIRGLVQMNPQDTRYALMTNDRTPWSGGWMSAQRLLESLDQVQVVDQRRRGTAVRDALQRRLDQEGSQGLKQVQTWIFSDFQKNQMSLDRPANGFKANLVSLGHDSYFNAVIDSAWILESTIRPGQRNRLVFRTRIYGEWPQGLLLQAELRWFDQRKSLMSLRDEGQPLRLDTFEFVPGPAEAGLVTLSLNDPGFPSDNMYYVSLPMHRKVKVLHLVNEQANPFVQAVWATDTLVQSEVHSIRQPVLPDLDSVDLLVVEGLPASLYSGIQSSIEAWVQSGESVVMLEGVPANVKDARPTPTRQEEPGSENLVRGRFRMQRLELSQAFLGQALTRQPQPDALPDVRCYRRVQVEAGDRVLLGLSNGDPFVLQKSLGEGDYYRFTVPLQDEWTDFVRHDLFLPVWYRLALGSLRSPALTGTLGGAREWSLPLPATWKDPSEWKMRPLEALEDDPKAWRPFPRISNGRCLLRMAMEQASPGFYRLDPGALRPSPPWFALNREPLESDLSTMNEDDLKKSYPDAKVAPRNQGTSMGKTFGFSGARGSLIGWLIGACLVFLAFEAALLGWRKA